MNDTKKRGPGRPPKSYKLTPEQRNAILEEAWSDSFNIIAKRYDISREYVRQLLRNNGINPAEVVEFRKAHQTKKREERDHGREMRLLEERVKEAVPCVVCGCWVLRKTRTTATSNRTCSPECARLWVTARIYLSDEEYHKHRISVARSILNHPKKARASQLDWAKRMLSDNPPPPNRRYVYKSSWVGSIARQVVPDRVVPHPNRDPDVKQKRIAYHRALTLLGRNHPDERREHSREFMAAGKSNSTFRAQKILKDKYPEEFEEIRTQVYQEMGLSLVKRR